MGQVTILGGEHENTGPVRNEWVQTVLEQTRFGYELRLSGWVDNKPDLRVMHAIYSP